MPCCLHGHPHPKHGCGSASLSSEYHECSFNSQNTPYNNYWADTICLFTELEEVTLQRDLFTWACRRPGKTSVQSSKQAPQIFTGRLHPRFWTCRKTALGCYLGEELCVVGLVGNGLPIPKVTVAGSCVSCWNSIAEMGGKRAVYMQEQPYPWICTHQVAKGIYLNISGSGPCQVLE